MAAGDLCRVEWDVAGTSGPEVHYRTSVLTLTLKQYRGWAIPPGQGAFSGIAEHWNVLV